MIGLVNANWRRNTVDNSKVIREISWEKVRRDLLGKMPPCAQCGKPLLNNLSGAWAHARFCPGVRRRMNQSEAVPPHEHLATACEDGEAHDAGDAEHDESSESRHADEVDESVTSAMKEAAFRGLTNLRLNFNASHTQVEGVKTMVENILAPVHQALQAKLAPLMQVEQVDLGGLIGGVCNVFDGMRSAYYEGKMRAEKLPDLSPVRRVLGVRHKQITLPDGRVYRKTTEDVAYDFDVLRHLEAMFKYNPDTCADVLSSMERWRAAEQESSASIISDVCHGIAFQRHPFILRSKLDRKPVILLQYYMDGLTLTNPLGAAHGRHKVAASYVVVLNLRPVQRTSPHCIIPVSICFEKDFSRYPVKHVVCGPEGDGLEGATFGAQMRRWDAGVTVRIPHQFSDNAAVDNSEGKSQLHFSGGLVLVSADTPAAALLFGTKRGFGNNTVSICRLCYCKQIDGADLHAHCKPNSFLPWEMTTQQRIACNDSSMRAGEVYERELEAAV